MLCARNHYIDGSHTEEDKGCQWIKKAYRDGTF